MASPELSPRRAIQVDGSTAPWVLFAIVVVASVLFVHSPGPDAHKYLDWCRVFATGDIFELRGQVATPRGLPSTWYSLGPGLMMAPPYLVYHWVTSGEGFQTAFGVGSFVLTWLGVLLLVLKRVRRSLLGVVFALVVVFFGTHAGFYSLAHASESVSLLAFVWLLVFLDDGDYQSRWKGLVFVTLGAFACLCRLPNAPIVAVFFFLWGWRAWSVLDSRRRWIDALSGLAIMLVTGWIIGTGNTWATGSFFASAYQIGDDSFQFAALTRPRFWREVLLHPWHGLFVYHPLYGLGVGYLLVKLVRRRLGGEDAAVLLAFGAMLYLQASWFCWWMGGSFGMRAFAPISVLLVLPLVGELDGRQSRVLAVAVAGLTLWSFLLYLNGNSTFLTYEALLAAQQRTLATIFEDGAARLSIAVLVLIGGAAFATIRGSIEDGEALLRRRVLPVVGAIFALLFVSSTLLFARAAVATHELIARDEQWGRRTFGSVNTYRPDLLAMTLREYSFLPGYEDEKAALRGFLERNPNVPYQAYLRDRVGPRHHAKRFGLGAR